MYLVLIILLWYKHSKPFLLCLFFVVIPRCSCYCVLWLGNKCSPWLHVTECLVFSWWHGFWEVVEPFGMESTCQIQGYHCGAWERQGGLSLASLFAFWSLPWNEQLPSLKPSLKVGFEKLKLHPPLLWHPSSPISEMLKSGWDLQEWLWVLPLGPVLWYILCLLWMWQHILC